MKGREEGKKGQEREEGEGGGGGGRRKRRKDNHNASSAPCQPWPTSVIRSLLSMENDNRTSKPFQASGSPAQTQRSSCPPTAEQKHGADTRKNTRTSLLLSAFTPEPPAHCCPPGTPQSVFEPTRRNQLRNILRKIPPECNEKPRVLHNPHCIFKLPALLEL